MQQSADIKNMTQRSYNIQVATYLDVKDNRENEGRTAYFPQHLVT